MRGLNLLLIVGTMAGTATGANAVTYSFETPSEPNGAYIYHPTSDRYVTYNGHSGVSSQGSPFFSSTPPDGSQAAFIQSVDPSDPNGPQGQVSMTIGNLTAGAFYSISFWLADRPGYERNPVFVSFAGQPLGEFTANGTDFSSNEINFVPTVTRGRLVFTGAPTTNGDNDVNLDDVVVNSGIGVAGAVPEPATWALMLGGFGLVGAAVRRRGAATVTA